MSDKMETSINTNNQYLTVFDSNYLLNIVLCLLYCVVVKLLLCPAAVMPVSQNLCCASPRLTTTAQRRNRGDKTVLNKPAVY